VIKFNNKLRDEPFEVLKFGNKLGHEVERLIFLNILP